MKKTISIRLFFLLVALGCCLSYGGGYYFSIRQSKEPMAQEQATEEQESEIQLTASMESTTAVSPYKFILSNEDGYIAVYYEDGKTLHSYTDIKVDGLPMRLQKEISQGKEIYSEAELYNFLENYSS